jgi:ribokinase
VSLLGAVGKDMYADMELESLKAVGVDVSHVLRRAEGNTGVALITVNGEGDNSIVVVSGANNSMSPKDIDDNLELLKASDMIIFQLEIPISTVLYAAKKAKELGKTVILDPAPVPAEFPDELFRYVDLIKPNETELGMLAGAEYMSSETADKSTDKNLTAAVDRLRKRGAKDILVTLGEKGVYMDCLQTGITRIPAISVKAVDTTAAGDAFTGALGVMLAEGKTMEEAATFANYVSSIVVTRKGAQASIPTLEEVNEYINRFL